MENKAYEEDGDKNDMFTSSPVAGKRKTKKKSKKASKVADSAYHADSTVPKKERELKVDAKPIRGVPSLPKTSIPPHPIKRSNPTHRPTHANANTSQPQQLPFPRDPTYAENPASPANVDMLDFGQSTQCQALQTDNDDLERMNDGVTALKISSTAQHSDAMDTTAQEQPRNDGMDTT